MSRADGGVRAGQMHHFNLHVGVIMCQNWVAGWKGVAGKAATCAAWETVLGVIDGACLGHY